MESRKHLLEIVAVSQRLYGKAVILFDQEYLFLGIHRDPTGFYYILERHPDDFTLLTTEIDPPTEISFPKKFFKPYKSGEIIKTRNVVLKDITADLEKFLSTPKNQ